MNQTTLLEVETIAEAKFQEFHKDNPEVYRRLVRMTFDLVAVGHRKIGMKMLFEVIRWRTMLQTTDPDYKMNNNYTSRYARMIMDDYPKFDGVFEIRELKS